MLVFFNLVKQKETTFSTEALTHQRPEKPISPVGQKFRF